MNETWKCDDFHRFLEASFLGWWPILGGYLLTGVLGGGFKHFLFSPLPGEMIQFDQYFSDGLKPPTSAVFPQQKSRTRGFEVFLWGGGQSYEVDRGGRFEPIVKKME